MFDPVRGLDEPQLLTGWGRTAPSAAEVRRVESARDVCMELQRAAERGVPVLARGLGRSYGDSAQSGGGVVLRLVGKLADSGDIVINESQQTVTAPAGVSIDQLISALLSFGWFVPVTPGTRQVTLGGAIAADIHGKNHHVDGSFAAAVTSIDIVDGVGSSRTLTPSDSNADVFWATTGGMGLTGIMTGATFRVRPIESSRMRVDTAKHGDLDSLLAGLMSADRTHHYTVGWVDTVPVGRKFGRGIITSGEHATRAELPAALKANPYAACRQALAGAPPFVPTGLLNPMTVRAFNAAWYAKAPQSRTGEVLSLGQFFHPLDGVRDWNRLYGKRGFLQYQFAVPDTAAHLIGVALKRLRAIGAASFLTVLKRLGQANPAPLSFPTPGWTLALDIPAGVAGLSRVLDALDEEVAAAGGRVYLAKDSRVRPELLAAMYPRLAQWREIRREMDPHGLIRSDQSERLAL
jgi:decaprenylphospho-beta-D-ribofuranose 2-oxidase